MPPWTSMALGLVMLMVIIGLAVAPRRLPGATIRDPQARLRVERRKASQKRQDAVRARREALQREAARRDGTG